MAVVRKRQQDVYFCSKNFVDPDHSATMEVFECALNQIYEVLCTSGQSDLEMNSCHVCQPFGM